jgi:hypothetical protein
MALGPLRVEILEGVDKNGPKLPIIISPIISNEDNNI